MTIYEDENRRILLEENHPNTLKAEYRGESAGFLHVYPDRKHFVLGLWKWLHWTGTDDCLLTELEKLSGLAPSEAGHRYWSPRKTLKKRGYTEREDGLWQREDVSLRLNEYRTGAELTGGMQLLPPAPEKRSGMPQGFAPTGENGPAPESRMTEEYRAFLAQQTGEASGRNEETKEE